MKADPTIQNAASAVPQAIGSPVEGVRPMPGKGHPGKAHPKQRDAGASTLNTADRVELSMATTVGKSHEFQQDDGNF
ncbi:hypothetical protein MTO96_015020 [Rhipicephalus appendiculatus]